MRIPTRPARQFYNTAAVIPRRSTRPFYNMAPGLAKGSTRPLQNTNISFVHVFVREMRMLRTAFRSALSKLLPMQMMRGLSRHTTWRKQALQHYLNPKGSTPKGSTSQLSTKIRRLRFHSASGLWHLQRMIAHGSSNTKQQGSTTSLLGSLEFSPLF